MFSWIVVTQIKIKEVLEILNTGIFFVVFNILKQKKFIYIVSIFVQKNKKICSIGHVKLYNAIQI